MSEEIPQRPLGIGTRLFSMPTLGWELKNILFGDLADETDELVLSLEESEKIAAEAMAFRASLPDTDPESPNFKVESIKDMSEGERMAKKYKDILADWERILTDLPAINGRIYDDIINTADYDTELHGKHQFRYEPTDDADDFQVKMLEVYHGGFMYAGEDKAYRFTRRIYGGPLFHYISNCEKLDELKTFMMELYGFWKKHTEPYRIALVEQSSISDKSLSTSTKSVEHHEKVKKFCERTSKADAREHANNAKVQELTCVYEMHRVAVANEDDVNSATIRRKIGKIHSTGKSLCTYFLDSQAGRRNPFKYDNEDEAPPPTTVDGNILCFIERDGTLFAWSKHPDLSNYLVEFIEVFATAALYPTINICPSINQLGDYIGARDDPKFFANVQRIVHLIGMNKFQTVHHSRRANRDAEKYSEKEWEELIDLSIWMNTNITVPSNKGELFSNRADYLEMIGFDRILRENDTKNHEWMTNFTSLKNHARVHGFQNWSDKKTGGKKLHKWFRNQKREFLRGALKKAKYQWRHDLLNSINFPWP